MRKIPKCTNCKIGHLHFWSMSQIECFVSRSKHTRKKWEKFTILSFLSYSFFIQLSSILFGRRLVCSKFRRCTLCCCCCFFFFDFAFLFLLSRLFTDSLPLWQRHRQHYDCVWTVCVWWLHFLCCAVSVCFTNSIDNCQSWHCSIAVLPNVYTHTHNNNKRTLTSIYSLQRNRETKKQKM